MSSKSPPSFQFYPGDWLGSLAIGLMTPEQEGAYIRLLCYDWMKDGIPDDDVALATASRLGKRWLKVGSKTLRACFIPHPTKPHHLTNKRLIEVRKINRAWRKKCSKGGKKATAKRWGKESSSANGGDKGSYPLVTDYLQVNGNSSSPSSSSKERIKERRGPFPQAANGSLSFSPKIKYPDTEHEMIAVLEAHGIEYNPDYDGSFFDNMTEAGWMIRGEPVWDWPATYAARLMKSDPGANR